MKKSIAIIAGEPNSISSEIIFKCWKLRKKFTTNPIFIIGSIDLLNSQKKKLNYKIKLKKINDCLSLSNLKSNEMPIYDIKYEQKKPFEKISSKSNKYILKSFNLAMKLAINKKILGFVNCPISKETFFNKKYQGVTEFLAKKSRVKDNVAMLLYNKELSVSPLTTHISLKQVSKKISKSKIVRKVKILNNFYKKVFKKKPKIAILGLNPHNFSTLKKSEEKEIIKKAVDKLLKLKIKVYGPIPADSSFMIFKKDKFNIILGMYHDQVLAPFKALYGFKAVNVTAGLPYIRVSPDHGIAKNITCKNIANPTSLIESIKFFKYLN